MRASRLRRRHRCPSSWCAYRISLLAPFARITATSARRAATGHLARSSMSAATSDIPSKARRSLRGHDARRGTPRTSPTRAAVSLTAATRSPPYSRATKRATSAETSVARRRFSGAGIPGEGARGGEAHLRAHRRAPRRHLLISSSCYFPLVLWTGYGPTSGPGYACEITS